MTEKILYSTIENVECIENCTNSKIVSYDIERMYEDDHTYMNPKMETHINTCKNQPCKEIRIIHSSVCRNHGSELGIGIDVFNNAANVPTPSVSDLSHTHLSFWNFSTESLLKNSYRHIVDTKSGISFDINLKPNYEGLSKNLLAMANETNFAATVKYKLAASGIFFSAKDGQEKGAKNLAKIIR